MSIHEGAKRLTRPASETIKELSASLSVDEDAYPMFSTSVGRVCVRGDYPPPLSGGSQPPFPRLFTWGSWYGICPY